MKTMYQLHNEGNKRKKTMGCFPWFFASTVTGLFISQHPEELFRCEFTPRFWSAISISFPVCGLAALARRRLDMLECAESRKCHLLLLFQSVGYGVKDTINAASACFLVPSTFATSLTKRFVHFPLPFLDGIIDKIRPFSIIIVIA